MNKSSNGRNLEGEKSNLGRAGIGVVVLVSDILNLLLVEQPIRVVSQTDGDTGLGHTAE